MKDVLRGIPYKRFISLLTTSNYVLRIKQCFDTTNS